MTYNRQLRFVWHLLVVIALATLVTGLTTSCLAEGVVEYDGALAPDGSKNPEPLLTADGVEIVLSYYPGSKGTESVPVVLLHDFEGSRADYRGLALKLQEMGCAVIVPDLRGHGHSTKQRGSTMALSTNRLSPNEYRQMVLADMSAVRDLIWEKNNEKELNAEAICVVGSGMGASVALFWAGQNWSRLPNGNARQGQDIKAMVLISPTFRTPGLPLSAAMAVPPPKIALTDPVLQGVLRKREVRGSEELVPPAIGSFIDLDFRSEVSAMIMVGKNEPKATSDATRLYKLMERFHETEGEAVNRTLFNAGIDTTLQGTALLSRPELPVQRYVIGFIDLKLIKRKYPWTARQSNPYAEN